MCPYTYIKSGHICDPASDKRKRNPREKKKEKEKEKERAQHVNTAV
jgi:hypothetical protein